MKIGLTYDLSAAVELRPDAPEDANEEYDPPGTIDALAAEIEAQGHEAIRLGGGKEFLRNILAAPVDFVFNIAEGRGAYRSREAQVPSVLEMLQVPYSGSDPLTLAVALDKPAAKVAVRAAGVNTPEYRVVTDLAQLRQPGFLPLAFPLVVKPSCEGSSKGVRLNSRVANPGDLHAQARHIIESYRQPALVEAFVPGIEVTVGIVGNHPPQLVGIMEIVPRQGPDANFMYTLEVKRNWRETVSYRCPPQLPAACLRELEAAALAAYEALGCRDLARLDFRVDPQNRPWFIEANPLPGLSPVYGDLPIMASLLGWSYRRLIAAVLEAALERCQLARPRNAHRVGV